MERFIDWLVTNSARVPFVTRHPKWASALIALVVFVLVGPAAISGWFGFFTSEPPVDVLREIIPSIGVDFSRVDLSSIPGVGWAVTRAVVVGVALALLVGIFFGQRRPHANAPDTVDPGTAVAVPVAHDRDAGYEVEARIHAGLTAYLHVRNRTDPGSFEVIVESISGLKNAPGLPYYAAWFDPDSPIPNDLSQHRVRRIATGGFANTPLLGLWGHPQTSPFGLNALSVPRTNASPRGFEHPQDVRFVDVSLRVKVVCDVASPVERDIRVVGGHPIGLWLADARLDLELVRRFARNLTRATDALTEGSRRVNDRGLFQAQMQAWRTIVASYLAERPTFIAVTFDESIPADIGQAETLAATWAARLDTWSDQCEAYAQSHFTIEDASITQPAMWRVNIRNSGTGTAVAVYVDELSGTDRVEEGYYAKWRLHDARHVPVGQIPETVDLAQITNDLDELIQAGDRVLRGNKEASALDFFSPRATGGQFTRPVSLDGSLTMRIAVVDADANVLTRETFKLMLVGEERRPQMVRT